MAGMECGLGRFGDARLEKGGPVFTRRWWLGRVRASASWRSEIAPKRYSSRAFSVTKR